MTVDEGLRNIIKSMWIVFDENADQKWEAEGVIIKEGVGNKLTNE